MYPLPSTWCTRGVLLKRPCCVLSRPCSRLSPFWRFILFKTRIASLECGKNLLAFGLHPVIRLDLQRSTTVSQLNGYIGERLRRSGLEDYVVDETLRPCDQLLRCVTMLKMNH